MQVNREILQEGWLIKSPPTKRILRARWRRRWFTLKQGEIPGQFCLEYYTDRNCRKLKGVIDLDQCEQVDSGLRLEHRKQKFQYMFDIKTPRRTYYLAADTEDDMRDWVNCICQVCNLHESSNDRQYYNLLPASNNVSKNEFPSNVNNNSKMSVPFLPTEHASANCIKNKNSSQHHINAKEFQDNAIIEATNELNINDLQHNNEMPYVNTEFVNRESTLCDKDAQNVSFEKKFHSSGSNEITLRNKQERSLSFKQKVIEKEFNTSNDSNSGFIPNHTRSKSEQISSISLTSNGGAVRKKIPENLVLTSNLEDSSANVEPSPALSTSSGPYIPLSQCFSGSPKYTNNPTTPLNNLDPKFYETPRNSHINFGLNLTNDQSYSPKITNFVIQNKSKSGHSSPSDSESVFTDEDDSIYRSSRNNSDRKARPSDSSVENDLIVFSYDQRFSKFPYENSEDFEEVKKHDENKTNDINQFEVKQKLKNPLELHTKRSDDKINSKDFPQFSDTENTSPASLAKNTSIWVADQRSQQYCNMNTSIAASTPNLCSENQNKSLNFGNIQSGTLPRSNPFMNIERNEENVFRYDFVEKGKSQVFTEENILPPVMRELKPKLNFEEKSPNSVQSKSTNTINKIVSSETFPIKPPSIDRTLKPLIKSTESPNRRSHIQLASSTIPSEFSSMHIGGETQVHTLPRINSSSSGHYGNNNLINNNPSNPIYNNNNLFLQHINSPTLGAGHNSISNTLHIPSPNQMQKLEYCDLEIANGPSCTNRTSIISTISQQSDTKTPPKSSTVYRSIDFEKTRVLNQIREDSQVRSRRKD